MGAEGIHDAFLEHLGQDLFGAPKAEPVELGDETLIGGLTRRAPPIAAA